MAATIVATAGAANANSYATLAEARAYYDTNLWATNDDLDDDDLLTRALITATSVINEHFEFDGAPTSSDQALPCPRSGLVTRAGANIDENTIWPELKYACAELARLLLEDELTADNDASTQGLKRVKAGPVDLEFDGTGYAKPIPDRVERMLSPWATLRGNDGTVKLIRC